MQQLSSDNTVSIEKETPSIEDIGNWIINKLAVMLNTEPGNINVNEKLGTYGLDSVEVVTITAELSEWLGIIISPSELWDHNTIEKLSVYASQLVENR